MTDRSLDIEKALAMTAGQDIDSFYNAKVSEQDKTLVRDALENIFQGKSVIEWANGCTLMSAWNTALDAIRDEFFATSRRDAIIIFLQRAVFEHRDMWHRKICTNDNRLQVMQDIIDKNTVTELVKHAEFQMQQGYETIKKIVQKYDNGFRPVPKQNQPVACTLVKEYENENVRERVK